MGKGGWFALVLVLVLGHLGSQAVVMLEIELGSFVPACAPAPEPAPSEPDKVGIYSGRHSQRT